MKTHLLMIAACASFAFAPAAAQVQQAAQLNVTGTWQGNSLGGLKMNLNQEGNRVWGRGTYGYGVGFVRGTWVAGRLFLIFTDVEEKIGGACPRRFVIVLASLGSAAALDAVRLLDLSMGSSIGGMPITRSSPDPGPVRNYPYEAELKNCGQLFTYDLEFATGSDQLIGTSGPILAALADVMKRDASLKIQIAGHTDATGDADADAQLSERRALMVKKVLVQKLGADAARISTKGWGPEQPLADNDTAEGRAINRRVEIVVSRWGTTRR